MGTSAPQDGEAHELPAVVGPDDDVEDALASCGAVLIRGLIWDLDGFSAHAERWLAPLMEYTDRATKRTRIGGSVLSSTETAPRMQIALHSEASFASRWPQRLLFGCRRPADRGGATPLADTRRVLARIDPALRKRISDLGVLYVRNYGGGPGLDWRDAFPVDDEDALARHCREAEIEIEWWGEGRLRASQRRPGLAVHPGTGETVWFNHAAVLHARALPATLQRTLARQTPESEWPQQVYFGDGSAIEADAVDHIAEAYAAEAVRFEWQAGDLLLVDNLLCAHGRDRFRGEREHWVALGMPSSWEEQRAA